MNNRALDAGVSEVFTDEDGPRYVPEFGQFRAAAVTAAITGVLGHLPGSAAGILRR
ncbi:MAG: hypothetical protein HY784_11060 [Chloroflexi bacterium]|nr:hypothetical protein [Chloroflexota bacterium]